MKWMKGRKINHWFIWIISNGYFLFSNHQILQNWNREETTEGPQEQCSDCCSCGLWIENLIKSILCEPCPNPFVNLRTQNDCPTVATFFVARLVVSQPPVLYLSLVFSIPEFIGGLLGQNTCRCKLPLEAVLWLKANPSPPPCRSGWSSPVF